MMKWSSSAVLSLRNNTATAFTFKKIIKTRRRRHSGVKGDSLQCREMSAQLTEGTGDRWETASS